MKLLSVLVLCWTLGPAASFAQEGLQQKLAQAALREARAIFNGEMFGHYDLTKLEIEKLEDLRRRISSERDFGLVRVTLDFSAKRNKTRHSGLNPKMFEPKSPMCNGTLYLHCKVPVGHVFEGKMEVVLAADRGGTWRTLSPHWRSRRQYPLHGYLVLEGRAQKGYVTD